MLVVCAWEMSHEDSFEGEKWKHSKVGLYYMT